jgi:hypothetical protein
LRRHDRTNIDLDFVQHGPHDPRLADLVLSGHGHASVQVDRGGDGNQQGHADRQRQQDL